MIRKYIQTLTVAGVILFAGAFPAFAHVIVYPDQVGVAATQDFTVNVPNEKDTPVTSVRLVIPNGVISVVPYVIPGWTITTKTTSNEDDVQVTEIYWDNGSIPVGQAEELRFQAQVPAIPTTLAWKAYQTYSDGTVVSWDINPATLKNTSDAQQDTLADKENKGEYSTTTVVDDLAAANSHSTNDSADNAGLLTIMSGVAILFSILALGVQVLRRR